MIHIYIFGRVQGVGYRAWSVRIARKYALSGWVRNRINGCVEILAQGENNNLNLFLSECRKGPLWASVKSVQPVEIPNALVYPIEEGLFVQKPTA